MVLITRYQKVGKMVDKKIHHQNEKYQDLFQKRKVYMSNYNYNLTLLAWNFLCIIQHNFQKILLSFFMLNKKGSTFFTHV